jgi:hypothetical protein
MRKSDMRLSRGSAEAFTLGAIGSLFLMMLGAAVPAAAGTGTTVTLHPTSGPVGTVVSYRGHVSEADLRLLPRGKPLHGLEGGSGGCELDVNLSQDVIHLNRKKGTLSGTFVVGSTGACKQVGPSSASVQPGTYYFYFGCEACELAPFAVTSSNPVTLPFTGGAELPTTGLGLLLVAVGFIALRTGRRRRAPARRTSQLA